MDFTPWNELTSLNISIVLCFSLAKRFVKGLLIIIPPLPPRIVRFDSWIERNIIIKKRYDRCSFIYEKIILQIKNKLFLNGFVYQFISFIKTQINTNNKYQIFYLSKCNYYSSGFIKLRNYLIFNIDMINYKIKKLLRKFKSIYDSNNPRELFEHVSESYF